MDIFFGGGGEEGVSNMRATDWCVSGVRDVAERLMEEVYVHSCPKSIGRDFHLLNMRISPRQNEEWLLNFVIWSDSIRVILKSDKRAARVRFEITILMSDQNCTTRSSIITLLQPF